MLIEFRCPDRTVGPTREMKVLAMSYNKLHELMIEKTFRHKTNSCTNWRWKSEKFLFSLVIIKSSHLCRTYYQAVDIFYLNCPYDILSVV